MPVHDGPKSDSEKFAGASKTYSIEALMGDGRALQAGTSHDLGQNFAKAFDIQFQGRDKTLQHAWTTSWGVSTRLIGGVIMTHGDDSGLILPPKVAPYQVVIVPIPRGNWQETVLPKAREIRDALTAAGIRVMLDDRDAYTPGWKFAEWEMRGVPLRLEIGPKDIEKSQVMLARRDTREKMSAPMDSAVSVVSELLDAIQANLFERALKFREEHTTSALDYAEFQTLMEGRPGFVISPWCGSAECEAEIKAETQATIRNVPFCAPPAQGALHQVRRARGRRWRTSRRRTDRLEQLRALGAGSLHRRVTRAQPVPLDDGRGRVADVRARPGVGHPHPRGRQRLEAVGIPDRRRWRRTCPPATAPDPARSCRADRRAPRCSRAVPGPGARSRAVARPAGGRPRAACPRPSATGSPPGAAPTAVPRRLRR